MIGRVKSISKFGLFIHFSETKVGLLRWSNLPKRPVKFKVGDLVGVEILKAHEDGKYELSFVEKNFKECFGEFLEKTREQLNDLKIKNEELKRQ